MRFYCTSWLEWLNGVVPTQMLTGSEAVAQKEIIDAQLQAEIEAGLQAEARYWAFLNEETEIGDNDGN